MQRVFVLSLIALSFVAYLGKSYEPILRGIDSNIHAAASLDATSMGFAPKLPIHLNSVEKNKRIIFNDHPFLFFWINGGIMRLVDSHFSPPSAWSARIITGVFSVGCVFLVYLLGSLFHSQIFGAVAATFMLFTRDLILTGATMSLDPPMLFFILLSFVFYLQGSWLALGITCGIGLWIKTPIVLLVFPVALSNLLIFKDKRISISKLFFAGAIAIGVGSFIWIATGIFGGWDLVADYWQRQVWGTAVEGRSSGSSQDWFLGFQILGKGFLPGLPFFLFACFQIYRKKLYTLPFVRISSLAILITFGAVTFLRFKLGHYFNPIFPFLALLSTYSVHDWVKKHEEGFYFGFTVAAFSLMTLLLSSPVSLGPEVFHLLRRAIPVIQERTSCHTPIYLTGGAEPIGSILDYSLVLDHYVRRSVGVIRCEDLPVLFREKQQFVWMGGQEHITRCLSDTKIADEEIIQMGGQVVVFHGFGNVKKNFKIWDSPLRADLKCYGSLLE